MNASTLGYDKDLLVLPFDQRSSFEAVPTFRRCALRYSPPTDPDHPRISVDTLPVLYEQP